MATIINADTSNGLKLTSDTSGIIELQSGGTTKAIVNSSGLTSSGHILQVVNARKDSSAMATTSSSTLSDTGLTVDITPSATSSRIYLRYDLTAYLNGGGLDTGVTFLLNRKIGSGSFSVLPAACNIATSGCIGLYFYSTASGNELIDRYGDSFVDSPSTTSTITYKITFAVNNGGTCNTGLANHNANITVMEVAG